MKNNKKDRLKQIVAKTKKEKKRLEDKPLEEMTLEDLEDLEEKYGCFVGKEPN